MSPRPERPSDADYYERYRVELFSQGDLFRDVPLAYPLPAEELLVDEASPGSRRFLSGPLAFGSGMLITPSCSLGAQGAEGYGHPVRTLVPVIPLAELVGQGVVKETALADLRRFDHLINYMYLPPLEVDELEFGMPESVALLYMPVTLHHAFLEGQRVSQLAYRSAQQLQRKLVWFYSGFWRMTLTSSIRRWIDGRAKRLGSGSLPRERDLERGVQRTFCVRSLFATFALVLFAASATGAAPSASQPRVLALEGGTLGVASRLVAVDPRTLDVVRRGAQLPSWAFGYVYVRAPDGGTVAITPRPSSTADHLYFVDTETLGARGFLALGQTPCALAWPKPAVVLALVSTDCGAGPLHLLSIDPTSRRIVARSPAGSGTVQASARVPGGLVAVLATSGRARLVVASTRGVQSTALPWHVRRNELVVLAIDARGGHVYIAAGLQIADVRLGTLTVQTRALTSARTTSTTDKGTTGPLPSLAFVTPGKLAIALGQPGPNDTVRPRGAWLVNTSNWRRRLLTTDASKVVAGDGAVIAFDGEPGSGALLFSTEGRLRSHLADGSTVDGASVVDQMLLLDLQGTPAGFSLRDGHRTFYGGDDSLLFSLLGPTS